MNITVTVIAMEVFIKYCTNSFAELLNYFNRRKTIHWHILSKLARLPTNFDSTSEDIEQYKHKRSKQKGNLSMNESIFWYNVLSTLPLQNSKQFKLSHKCPTNKTQRKEIDL